MFNRLRPDQAEAMMYFGAGIVAGTSTDVWLSLSLTIGVYYNISQHPERNSPISGKILSYVLGWFAGATYRVAEFAHDLREARADQYRPRLKL